MAKRFLGGGEVASESLIPVGSIISYFPGYFNSLTQHISGVSTIAEINNILPSSWRVCDGSWIGDSSSPVFRGNDTYLPDLTDSRFLRGSSIHGAFGGSQTATLLVENLPAHTHSIASHRHTINHKHSASSSRHNGHTHTHGQRDQYSNGNHLNSDGFASGEFSRTRSKSSSRNGTHSHAITVSSYHGYSGQTALTTRSTGSSTAFSIEPQYMDVIYIMKIK